MTKFCQLNWEFPFITIWSSIQARVPGWQLTTWGIQSILCGQHYTTEPAVECAYCSHGSSTRWLGRKFILSNLCCPTEAEWQQAGERCSEICTGKERWGNLCTHPNIITACFLFSQMFYLDGPETGYPCSKTTHPCKRLTYHPVKWLYVTNQTSPWPFYLFDNPDLNTSCQCSHGSTHNWSLTSFTLILFRTMWPRAARFVLILRRTSRMDWKPQVIIALGKPGRGLLHNLWTIINNGQPAVNGYPGLFRAGEGERRRGRGAVPHISFPDTR